MPLDIILHNPEIPQNTGNIIRLCANTGASLHLIEPLGFEWSDKKLRRAGLDYHQHTQVQIHQSLEDYLDKYPAKKLVAFSTKGIRQYTSFQFTLQDSLIFGPETKGLNGKLLQEIGSDRVLRIPMQKNSRSLNLSNSVSIAIYEAWRQFGFCNHPNA